MTRGDIFLAVLIGDYAKPRPVVVIQADIVRALESTLVCPLTTFEESAAWIRPVIEPSSENGLRHRSYAMVDKVGAAPARRFRDRIGRADTQTMLEIDRALRIVLGLA